MLRDVLEVDSAATTFTFTFIRKQQRSNGEISSYLAQARRNMTAIYLFRLYITRHAVCLSVSKITEKTRAWISMKCCVSTDVVRWTNF